MEERKKLWFYICMIVLITSCTPYRAVVNYDETPIPTEPQLVSNYSPIVLQSNDIVSITIVSLEEEAVAIFNSASSSGYLIDKQGMIDFPYVGKVAIQGLSVDEAKVKLQEKLSKYFVQAPGVQMSLMNFKVIVNGEVGSPGVLQVPNERMSIIDAITMSGDFTLNSNRDSILIIREQNGQRTFGYVNFNSVDIFESPYFYLRQNDIVYVKPEKRILASVREKESRYIPYISIVASLSLLVSTFIRFIL